MIKPAETLPVHPEFCFGISPSEYWVYHVALCLSTRIKQEYGSIPMPDYGIQVFTTYHVGMPHKVDVISGNKKCSPVVPPQREECQVPLHTLANIPASLPMGKADLVQARGCSDKLQAMTAYEVGQCALAYPI